MADTEAQNRDWPRRILLAGGHHNICGGLEIFIARAQACLGIDAHCYTQTPGGGARSVLSYARHLWFYFRQLKSYDIVWLHYGSAFDLAYLAVAKLAGKKVAVTPHLGRGWRTMRVGVLRALCNRTLSYADVIFTLYAAQPTELSFPTAVKRRCIVMGTFLPQTLLETTLVRAPKAGAMRLLHLARLSAAKGSFAFLDVCVALRDRGVPFEATMAGHADEDAHHALRAEIARKDLTVTLLGAVPTDSVTALLCGHDVLVNLSRQDAYPLTVLEALLCGVVPVCSKLPGTEEMARETPAIVLVDGQGAQSAADRILTLDFRVLADGAGWARRKFGWDGMRAKYREAFTRLAGAGTSVYRADVTRAISQ